MCLVVKRSASNTSPTPIAFLLIEVVYTGVLRVFYKVNQNYTLLTDYKYFQADLSRHHDKKKIWSILPGVWGGVLQWEWFWEWVVETLKLWVCCAPDSFFQCPSLPPPDTGLIQNILTEKRKNGFLTCAWVSVSSCSIFMCRVLCALTLSWSLFDLILTPVVCNLCVKSGVIQRPAVLPAGGLDQCCQVWFWDMQAWQPHHTGLSLIHLHRWKTIWEKHLLMYVCI